jgi:Phosphopantetheine attachment site
MTNTLSYDEHTVAVFRARYLELLSRLVVNPAQSVAELVDASNSPTAQRLSRLGSRDDFGGRASAALGNGEAPPLAPMEQILVDAWADLLGLSKDQFRPTDNFFDLGGNSLLAMQAVERIAARTGRRIPPRLYVYETLSQLAVAYDGERDIAPPPQIRSKGGLLNRLTRWLKRDY